VIHLFSPKRSGSSVKTQKILQFFSNKFNLKSWMKRVGIAAAGAAWRGEKLHPGCRRLKARRLKALGFAPRFWAMLRDPPGSH